MARHGRWALLVAAAMLGGAGDELPPGGVVQSTDLRAAFGTRGPRRFVATQGAPVADTIGMGGDQVPGEVRVCLQKGDAPGCDSALDAAIRAPAVDDDLFARPHYLDYADVVHPRGPGGPALLLVQIASLHSVDGDQAVRVQAVAYDAAKDGFVRVYDHETGRNNNQEVRYVKRGTLAGDIVSAEPTRDAPYGYWITVNAWQPGEPYKAVLRYRSGTHYGDGNPLAVIDSEMPETLRRLGLWRAGMALPLPEGGCARPHLVAAALWCQ